METTVVAKIQETGQHAAKRTEAIFARTRDAGVAFVAEVRGAGQEIVGFARAETKGWRRFLTQRTTQLKTGARSFFAAPEIERTLLRRVDGTLRAWDAKVRARLTFLEKGTNKGPRKPVARRGANGKAPATRRAKSGAATRATTPSGLAGTALRQ
jgi:hypothetical protein